MHQKMKYGKLRYFEQSITYIFSTDASFFSKIEQKRGYIYSTAVKELNIVCKPTKVVSLSVYDLSQLDS